MANYLPPYSCHPLLGPVVELFTSGRVTQLNLNYPGVPFIGILPFGQLFYESNLELDTDGSIYHKQDKTGQGQTSLRDSAGNSVDSNSIPYFVLPQYSFGAWGIQTGNLGMVFYNARQSGAILADRGPVAKLGEGSIELHRRLGHETVINGKLHNCGISGRILTIVFPRSGNGCAMSADAVDAAAFQCWLQLRSMVSADLSRHLTHF